MSPLCAQIDAFFDGQLSAEDADAFRLHLGECEACGRALYDRTMLHVLADAHRPELVSPEKSGARTAPRPSVLNRIGRPLAALAIAAGLLGVAARSLSSLSHANRPPLLALETEGTRAVEVRFTYGPADKYRPYNVHRGGAAPHDSIPMSTLAALEEMKDYRGLAAALALSGDIKRAPEYLAKSEETPDTDSDRAALAIASGHPEQAIDLVDSVLLKQPNHPQALWNQALAMEALHLPLVAAESWAKLAAEGEPGWSAEAKRRGEDLHAAFAAHRKEWLRLLDACNALALRGELPASDLVTSNPTMVRNWLYHAMNAAPTMDRLTALRPLAERLDGGEVRGPLVRQLERLTAAGFEGRRPFLERYITLFRDGPDGDGSEAVKLINELRAAGEDDLLVSAIDRAYLWREYAADLDRLASMRGDPWITLLAQRAHAKGDESSGNYGRAERALRSSLDECDQKQLGLLCTRFAFSHVKVLLSAFRLREAEKAAVAALPRAEAYSDAYSHQLRWALARAAVLRGDYPLARAYALDATLREPEFCAGRSDAYEISAEGYLAALDPEAAKRELESGPPCGPFSLGRAKQLVLLSRVGQKLSQAEHLVRDIDAARPRWSRAENLRADSIVGNLLLATDPSRGEQLLRSTLKEAEPIAFNSDARAAVDWSLLSLGFQSALHGDGAGATSLFAEHASLADPRCTLTVGVDHERSFSVVEGADGVPTVATVTQGSKDPPPYATLLSAASLERLRACPEVRVLASAPLHAIAALLPSDMAWSYRVEGGRGVAPAGAAGKRLVVSDVTVPTELSLPQLSGFRPNAASPSEVTTWLRGADATVGRVLGELASASEVQIHTHGLTDVGESDAPLLVLTPDALGKWALTARDVATIRLSGHPVVALAACNSAQVGVASHEHWSLPAAFIQAGARSVIASTEAIPDGQASEFFDSVLLRIRAGSPPAVALRDDRMLWRKRPGGSWVDSLVVFD